jgi:predicted Zn-dependent protease
MLKFKAIILCCCFFHAIGITTYSQAANTSGAVSSLLLEAKKHFNNGKNEQAAALLERALRIAPRDPVLWHNLAGVRLQQESWAKSASLAAKSNTLSAINNKWLRMRNWTLIALACDGMGDIGCMKEARNRALSLAIAP